MMIEPPINELLTHVDCRYTLAVEAAKRARQLIQGDQPLYDTKELIGGSMPLIETRETKPLTIAIEEINRGLITYTRPESLEEE